MTSIYRKKSATGKQKINLICSLTYRYCRLCLSGSLLQSDLNDLRKLLLQNGYPHGIINYHILISYFPTQVCKFHSCVNLKIVSQNTRCVKSFFPYKDRINHSQQSRITYRANCWDYNGFYIGKTKHRLPNRTAEHFKALR